MKSEPTMDGPTAGGGMTRSDRVFGFIGLAALLLAIPFLVSWMLGGGSDEGAVAPAAVPALVLVEPVAGADLAQPVSVLFHTDAELAPDAMGWSADGRHVHLMLNGTEIMAAPRDVQRVSTGRYRWTLPRVPPGEYGLRVLWSGADHRPIEEGASETVRVRIR